MPPKVVIKYLNAIGIPWNVEYAAVKSEKFGDIQIGTFNGAIFFLYFAPPEELKSNVEVLMKRWRQAHFHENPLQMELLAKKIFSNQDDNEEVEVLLTGTRFQNIVWKTLLKIPEGCQWTYSDCAAEMGNPTAVRAVATAVAKNEVAYLIPCHRVVAKTGSKFKYTWGAECKKLLLDYEAGIKK